MLEKSNSNMVQKDVGSAELGHVLSEVEGVTVNQTSDAVFGEITEKGPNYRNVSLWYNRNVT